MKKSVFLFSLAFITIFLSMLWVVNAATTESELRSKLADRQLLNSLPNSVNPILSNVPSVIRNIIGNDAVMHVRIGSSNLRVVVSGGRVTSAEPYSPINPTHYAIADYNTALRIINANNPVTQAGQEFFSGNLIISRAPGCSSNLQCANNEVCISGSCRSALTLVAVPMGYASNERSSFESFASSEMNFLVSSIPISRDRVRVHYVDPSVCPSVSCSDACGDCQNAALNCANRAGLAGAADKIIAFSKRDLTVTFDGQTIPLCGCAAGIPSQTSVTRSDLCVTTAAHEGGHSFGLYHVNSLGIEGGACLGPNAQDCSDANKGSDIMGYRRPRDHYGPSARSYVGSLLSRFGG